MSATGKLFFKQELSRRDLEEGTEFEIHPDDEEDNSSSSDDESNVFDNDCFNSFKETLSSYEDACQNDSFDMLRTKMLPLTDDCKVWKKIIKHGAGLPLPERCLAVINYNAYTEGQKNPFDSTYQRNCPYKVVLGSGGLIHGLEVGVCTMKQGEISTFLIESEYAYGNLGCPPRIPPNSAILYEVEVVAHMDSACAIDYENMTPEERAAVSFPDIIEVCHVENRMGNDLFQRKLYKQAIGRYRKVVRYLDKFSVSNESEDNQRQKYLLKAYLNLSQCYLNTNNNNKAIIYAKLALKIDENNVKGLFRLGKALYLNDEYEQGERYLKRAKELSPTSYDVDKTLKELRSKRKIYENWQKEIYNGMFCGKAKASIETVESPEDKEFRSIIEDIVQNFMNSSDEEYSFSPGYTKSEIEVVQSVAKKYDLAFIEKTQDHKKIIKIKKQANASLKE